MPNGLFADRRSVSRCFKIEGRTPTKSYERTTAIAAAFTEVIAAASVMKSNFNKGQCKGHPVDNYARTE